MAVRRADRRRTMASLTDLSAGVLLAGIAVAATYDLTRREVPDNVWRILGFVGATIVAISLFTDGPTLPVLLWIVVAAYALQHFFPWTDWLSSRYPRAEVGVDIALAVGVIALVVGSGIAVGVGPGGVSYAVIALLVVTLTARALYELHLLSGGADAKALMAMGLVLPLFPLTLLSLGPAVDAFVSVIPFALNSLVNSAVCMLAVPVEIALRNHRAHDFRWRGGFRTYSIPLEELEHRFVWLDDPDVPDLGGNTEAETAEGDLEERRALVRTLRSRGVSRLRVSPQLPFVFFLLLGSALAIIAGNLLWDLAVWV